MSNSISVGLIGAGLVTRWHAKALNKTRGVAITAICDLDGSAASGLATRYNARAFASVDDLIASGLCDAVHILTPPDRRAGLAMRCLEGGLDVLLEQPVAENAAETRDILACAARTGRKLSVGHSVLALPAYEHLKSAVAANEYGRVSAAEITWALPLSSLGSSPPEFRVPQNPKDLFLELGSQPLALARDLFGAIEVLGATAFYPVQLPGQPPRPHAFRIQARAGEVEVTLHLSKVEVIDEQSVTVRGSKAQVRLDFASGQPVVDAVDPEAPIPDPVRQNAPTRRRRRTGQSNTWTRLPVPKTRTPFERGVRGMIQALYGAAEDRVGDGRFSSEAAMAVMQALDDTVAALPEDRMTPAAPAVQTRRAKPTALVIGGTGFIGRSLTRRLVREGRDVRVVSRGGTGAFQDVPDRVETVGISLDDLDGMTEAMRGMDVVFNLAKSPEDTCEAALEKNVRAALRIADAAEAAEVKRLVYTGTIASYDMSDPDQTITEETPLPSDMSDRNFYARSKAECERRLLCRHDNRGLPLVIARPGIVVGPGGPLPHWGLGRWHGSGAIRVWGHGRNILPFVLNDDVVDGLMRMIDADIEGQSFNLVGEPMHSARTYLNAICETLGVRIEILPGPLYRLYAGGVIKHALKTYVLRRRGAARPSLADWKSRAHFARFLNDKTKTVLGWRPEADREAFIRRSIDAAHISRL